MITLTPQKLNGIISVPPSKSISHRAIICASLAEGISTVSNLIFSDDTLVTMRAMENLGMKILQQTTTENNRVCLRIQGTSKLKPQEKIINCQESGSSLRFLIPLASLTGEAITFVGQGKLVTRPLNVYYDIFKQQNISYSSIHGLPLTIQGKLHADKFSMVGNVSSQFITGLLFTLPMLDGDSQINITTELESIGYIDLTLDTLKTFGINIKHENYRCFKIAGQQNYQPQNYSVEGDFSQIAFWLVAGTLGSKIKCTDINYNSLQGDREIIDIIKNMGGDIVFSPEEKCLTAIPTNTHGTIINAAQCPDIIPILSVLASLSEGETRIINAERLRIKESDRLKAMTTELNKLGADVTETVDGLIIQGKKTLLGGVTVDSWDDHRIAMSLAIASTCCEKPITITNSSCVKKSYPDFWQDFTQVSYKNT